MEHTSTLRLNEFSDIQRFEAHRNQLETAGQDFVRLASTIIPTHKLIGIDLTGSAKKASGFAVLQQGYAMTLRLKTDEEILDQIQRNKPALVSIDCPLSLPYGRISVFDDDPGRNEFGILRQSDRDLLRRGIRCYPPLLKSMQKLTLRGITLARRITDMGYPVIETFPGGVQDILGISRKQYGPDLLLRGLQQLGIMNLDSKPISHDELDAVTAAIAGLYYLAGFYDQVGNEQEGYIILPGLPAR